MRRLSPRDVLCTLALCVVLAGCAERDPPSPAPGVRLVTLGPHLTELVYSAGAGDRLVGAIAHSDYPPEAQSVPRVGDAFAIDDEQLLALAPTHVLAWVGGNPDSMLEQLRARGFNVVPFETRDLSSVATHLRQLGALAGTAQIAGMAATQYEVGLATLRARYADARPISVFVQVASEPLYTVTDLSPAGQLVRACGGRNIFGGLDTPAAAVTEESVVAADPEVMLTIGSRDDLVRWTRFGGSAVRNGQMYAINADHATRASLRLLQGAEEVCALLDRARQAPGDR